MPTSEHLVSSRLNDLTDELLESIAMLLEAHREKSALILLYSGVDILGGLHTDDGEATRESFVSWADRYMTPTSQLGCSALELYSARCGLLHALTPLTRLTKEGKARRFTYVTYPVFFPHENVPGESFIVHVGTLWLAFRDGARRFVADSQSSAERSERIERNLNDVYFTRTR
jgi:hypothetical protein